VDVNKVIADTLALLEHQFKVAKVEVRMRSRPSCNRHSGKSGKTAAGILESVSQREGCNAGRRQAAGCHDERR
jgi:hypothetical protein